MKRTSIARSTKPIQRKRSKLRRGALKDPAYLDWIRMLPCMICWPRMMFQVALDCLPSGLPRSEAAHVGVRGLGQKCSDRESVPLCEVHHRTGAESHHVLGKNFWSFRGLNRDKIIAELNRLYEEQR